ncbi:MAG: glycogen synthase [Candidatus Hydrothermarchaeota archaeon]
MHRRTIILAGEEAGPVSNKLGGIWNVINNEAITLAKLISKGEIKENIRLLIAGPYYPHKGTDWNAGKDRVTDISGLNKLNLDETLSKTLKTLKERGIDTITASKKVEGVEIGYILFDTSRFNVIEIVYKNKTYRLSDMIKTEAYELFGLDSLKYELSGYGKEYTHYLNLSYAISEFAKELSKNERVSLHCHEFGVFFAAARLELKRVPINTLATFHATIVGRSYGASVLEKVYNNDPTWNPAAPEGLAKLEELAKYADSITFVGDTTRKEARLFYGVDGIVVRNGIEVDKDHIDWEKKEKCRTRIQEFVAKNLYEYYDGEKIDPEHLIPLYTISRIELENKGYPDLLDSMIILDRLLANYIRNGWIDEETKVVCFLITAHGPKEKSRLPRGFPIYLPEEVLVGEELRLSKMIDDRRLHPKCLVTERRVVSTILYPQWVGKDDGGLNMTASEIASGCVAGIFPSKYEPFLLTGLEACREGTPILVGRSCGFSDAALEHEMRKGTLGGVIVVDNMALPYQEYISDYAFGMGFLVSEFIRDKVKYRLLCGDAFELAKTMSWEDPVKKYYELLLIES